MRCDSRASEKFLEPRSTYVSVYAPPNPLVRITSYEIAAFAIIVERKSRIGHLDSCGVESVRSEISVFRSFGFRLLRKIYAPPNITIYLVC